MTLWRASDQILVGNASVLGDAAKLAESGVTSVLRLQQSSDAATAAGVGTEGRLQRSTAVLCKSATGETLREQLAASAEALRAALCKAPPGVACDDAGPGDSSDEEEERDGIRMRVRLTRKPEEKWGIKWHRGLFKQSGMLVVEDVAEGSVLAKWNDRQPQHRRVAYGSKLLRINRVRPAGAGGAQAGPAMREEVQKETMRALFWRPGDEDPQLPGQRPGMVLICASDEAGLEGGAALAVAAAVAAAHQLLFVAPASGPEAREAEQDGEEDDQLESLLDSMGEAGAALQEPAASELLSALEDLQAAKAAEAEAKVEGEKDATTTEEPGSVIPAAQKAEGLGGASPVTPEPGRQEHTQAPGLESTPEAEGNGEEGRGDPAQDASWVYSCRKCSTALFHDVNLVPHSTDGIQKYSRRGFERGDQAKCTSVFVEPMSWMGDLEAQMGRLVCKNTRCRQKLGAFSWHGLPCSCGQWQSPAFQIHGARLDCMPVGRHARGPAPRAAFE